MTARRALALILTVAFFVLLMVGLMQWHWNYTKIAYAPTALVLLLVSVLIHYR